jgi:hypothetical protein
VSEVYTDVEVLQEILYRFFHIRKKDWGGPKAAPLSDYCTRRIIFVY